jgi:hypothetical protein
LLSFAVLFFFLGHSVESTVIRAGTGFRAPELPAVAVSVFLPVSAGVITCLTDKYRIENRLVYLMLADKLQHVLIVLGVRPWEAHMRNSVHGSRRRVLVAWMRCKKHQSWQDPCRTLLSRWKENGSWTPPLRLYQKALELLRTLEPELSRFISLSNMGNIYRRTEALIPRPSII